MVSETSTAGIAFEIVVILLLLVLNGVFSMSEMAMVAARKVRLEHFAEEGDKGAHERRERELANTRTRESAGQDRLALPAPGADVWAGAEKGGRPPPRQIAPGAAAGRPSTPERCRAVSVAT